MSDTRDPRRRPRFGRSAQEAVVAAVLLLAALYLRINLTDFIAGRRGGAFVDPDFWPGWLLNAAVVFALAYLVKMIVAVVRERAPDGGAQAPPRDDDPPTGPAHEEGLHEVAISGNTWKLFTGFALLWAYIYAMRHVGFILSTLVFSFAFLVFVGERRWKVIASFPVVLLAVLLYTFTRLLVVPLPRGSGFFLELSTFFY